MRMTQQEITSLYGSNVQDRSGKKLGTIDSIWVNAAGQPNWVGVRTGLFGMRDTMLPLAVMRVEQDNVSVPFDQEMIKKAPRVEADGDHPLTDTEVDQLYAHYHLDPAPPAHSTAESGRISATR